VHVFRRVVAFDVRFVMRERTSAISYNAVLSSVDRARL